MASAGSIRYARAEVEIGANLGPLQQGLNKARAELQSWGAGLMSIGSRMMGFGLAMAAPFALAVKAASDSEETLNKFRQVFGAQADVAEGFVKNLASSIGRGETEIRNGMSAMMAMFVGLGFGGEQARKMAEEVTALSYDFGSFFNIADDEAMQRFLSAFAGSSQVLDQFGMNIKADAMDLEFLRMGISKTTATATEQEKTLARLNIIRRTMASQGATGDALRTADSFANTWKRVKAQVLDSAIAIGQALLPAVAKVAGVVADGVKAFAAWIRQNSVVVVAAASVAGGLLGLGAVLTGLGAAFYAIGTAVRFLATGFGLLTVAKTILKLVAAGSLVVWGAFKIVLGLVGAAFGFVATMGAFAGAAISLMTMPISLAGVATKLAALATTAWGFALNFVAGAMLALPFVWLGVAIYQAIQSTGALGRAWRILTTTVSDAINATIEAGQTLFGNLATTATTALSGIQAAYMSGDWAGIWNIVKAAAKLAWFDITAFATDAFITWKYAVIGVFHSVADALTDIFLDAWRRIKAGFFEGLGTILNTAINITRFTSPTTSRGLEAVRGELAAATQYQPADTVQRDLDRRRRDAQNAGRMAEDLARAQGVGAARAREIGREAELAAYERLGRGEQVVPGMPATAAGPQRTRAEERSILQQSIDTLVHDAQWAFAEFGGTVAAATPTPSPTAPEAAALVAATESFGTFSGAAASGFAIGAAERTARATEEMVQLLRDQLGLMDEEEDMSVRYD